MSNQPNKPVKSFRSKGGITAAVWAKEVKRDGATFTRYTVSLDKRYRDRDGSWQTSSSLFPEDLPRVQLVLAKAFEFICLQGVDEPEPPPF